MTTTDPTTRDPVEGIVPLDEAARRLATNGTEWEAAHAVLTQTYPDSTRDDIIEAWTAAERAHTTTTTVQQQLDDLTERDDPARKLIRKGLLWPVVRLLIVDMAQPEPVVRAWLDDIRDATEAKKVKDAEWARVDEHIARAVALREERERQQDDTDVAPPEPVEVGDPAELLDEVEAYVRNYVVLPSEAAYVATTLWAAHTHMINMVETTPRLAILSPEPGSGKTRVLEVLEFLVRNPLPAFSISVSAMFRSVHADQSCVLMDETDGIWGRKAKAPDAEDKRTLVNSGYRAGGMVRRMGGANFDEVQEFSVFSPVALAGLDDLPETIMSRAVTFRMRKRAPSEKVARFRRRLAEPVGHALRGRMAAWVASLNPETVDATVDSYEDGTALHGPLPRKAEDRDADAWEPLVLVADLAGGSWPKRAREAAEWFLDNKPTAQVSLHQRLLWDIKSVWPPGARAVSCWQLTDALHRLDDGGWDTYDGVGLTTRKMGWLLSTNYDIRAKNIRQGGTVPKGYSFADFADWFERSAPHVEQGSALTAPPVATTEDDLPDWLKGDTGGDTTEGDSVSGDGWVPGWERS